MYAEMPKHTFKNTFFAPYLDRDMDTFVFYT